MKFNISVRMHSCKKFDYKLNKVDLQINVKREKQDRVSGPKFVLPLGLHRQSRRPEGHWESKVPPQRPSHLQFQHDFSTFTRGRTVCQIVLVPRRQLEQHARALDSD